mmetsp:Transcript_6376/g.16280  ORF Transcript_6376/g.16280 Transcript_6376/m.16280 type:complete len:120 (-) Transcript_6376:345-704(-)
MAAAAKDPYKPKRFMPAFMFFSIDVRPRLMAKHPGMSFSELGRRVGELWRSMSDQDRAIFEQLAEEDLERYHFEMRDYVPPQVSKLESSVSNLPVGVPPPLVLTPHLLSRLEHFKPDSP